MFAGLFIVLGILAYWELLALAASAGGESLARFFIVGAAVIAAFGVAGLTPEFSNGLFAVAIVSVIAPLLLQMPRARAAGAFAGTAVATTGSLYLGLPVYAAIVLRSLPGEVGSSWLAGIADVGWLPWEPAPRGLAWTLTVILATWFGDSAAYLGGRALGRHPLARQLSPKKTVEGALTGLAASAAAGAACFAAFGLGVWWLGALVGALLGVAGQLGDLAESFYKRQARVKDSGNLIPGHGGVLDRIDAMLFAFPVGLLIAAVLERP